MRIEVYLDGGDEPWATVVPPEKFKLDTSTLDDGPHELTFKAIDDDDVSSTRIIPFIVQNGPAITVHGVSPGETVSGEIDLLANAYAAKFGDEFEPMRIETPTPVPTWAWVLFLSIIAWGAGYLALEFHDRIDTPVVHKQPQVAADAEGAAAKTLSDDAWRVLGEQVYGNNCASCHQQNGSGLAGIFPPLTDNPAVLDDDPTDHIRAILDGLADKVIDGVSYPAPMPGFGAILSDAEVAAVVNYERTEWGNDAPLVTEADIARLR